VIRDYRPSDREVLLDVWMKAAAPAHPFYTDAMLQRERRDIDERYLPVAETYVFEEAGEVVGFIALLENEVGGIFVTPRCQGRGVGRALMDLARRSRPFLELDVYQVNARGRAFYEAYGFAVVGERLESSTGQTVLRLRLAPGAVGRRGDRG